MQLLRSFVIFPQPNPGTKYYCKLQNQFPTCYFARQTSLCYFCPFSSIYTGVLARTRSTFQWHGTLIPRVATIPYTYFIANKWTNKFFIDCMLWGVVLWFKGVFGPHSPLVFRPSVALSAQQELYPAEGVVKPWTTAEVDICELLLRGWPSGYLFVSLDFPAQPSLSSCTAQYRTLLNFPMLSRAQYCLQNCAAHTGILLWVLSQPECVQQQRTAQGAWDGNFAHANCHISADFFMATSCDCFADTPCLSKQYPSCSFPSDATLGDILVCSRDI